MPKILIKEKDYTSPGAAGNYSNYSVLITGFKGKVPANCSGKQIAADSNGVYEFTSASDFAATIGLIGPKLQTFIIKTKKDATWSIGSGKSATQVTGTKVTYTKGSEINHYGNQMAYELLNLGYPIIYKVLNIEPTTIKENKPGTDNYDASKPAMEVEGLYEKNVNEDGFNKQDATQVLLDSVNQATDPAFWAQFKDKASYDFRFITHGFLTAEKDTCELREYLSDYEVASQLLSNANIEADAETACPKEEGTGENGTTVDVNAAARLNKEESLYTDFRSKIAANNTISDNVKALFGFVRSNKEPDVFVDVTEADSDNQYTLVEGTAIKKYIEYITAKTTTSYNTPANFNTTTVPDTQEATPVTAYGIKTMLNDLLTGKQHKADPEDTTFTLNISEAIANYEQQNFTTVSINKINGNIANLAAYNELNAEASGRGDCVALIELAENEYTDTDDGKSAEELIVDGINKMSQINSNNGMYCAMTVPSVVYKMAEDPVFSGNKKFPGAFHYLTCFMNSLYAGFAEWYAAAGYTRGVSNFIIEYTTVKLGEIAVNVLEPRNIVNQATDPKFACNVIANFRGSYYLWGNRTADALGAQASNCDLTASSFLNIRQLCTTLKKQLYVVCRRFTFDPNSDTLWINFCNAIRPTLDMMRADQGIKNYRITKVVEKEPKKATLKAKIRIIPIEAVEDFDLEISLEDSFGDVSVTATESV